MIVLTIAAVVGLASFSVGAAVLTTIAARHPERAAGIVVVGAAVSAVGVVALGLLMVGISGMEGAFDSASIRRGGTVDIHPVRAIVGLTTAGALLVTAVRLARTGDWARVDREVGTEEATT